MMTFGLFEFCVIAAVAVILYAVVSEAWRESRKIDEADWRRRKRKDGRK